MPILNQPFQGQLGNVLIDKIENYDYSSLTIFSAFAKNSGVDLVIINFIDITPRFLPVFAEKFSFEYLRKSHKIPLFSNKLVTPGYTRIRSSL